MAEIYKLGGSSYFSESAYDLSGAEHDYAKFYWGKNAERLQSIKKTIDPNNVFGCHHCIGYVENMETTA